jgi:hypothetical protein
VSEYTNDKLAKAIIQGENNFLILAKYAERTRHILTVVVIINVIMLITFLLR